MLSINKAASTVKKNLPGCTIEKVVIYKNFYLFKVNTNDDEAGYNDPFYTVDIHSGKFDDFSLFRSGDIDKIVNLLASTPDYTDDGR